MRAQRELFSAGLRQPAEALRRSLWRILTEFYEDILACDCGVSETSWA